jgi:hypothetical protein
MDEIDKQNNPTQQGIHKNAGQLAVISGLSLLHLALYAR